MFVIVSLIILLVVLHVIGMQGLYYSSAYYDNLLHVLGGITASLIIYRVSKSHSAINIIIGVLVISLLWEVSEYLWDYALVPRYGLPVLQLGIRDTVFDLINNVIGAFIVIIFLIFMKRKFRVSCYK